MACPLYEAENHPGLPAFDWSDFPDQGQFCHRAVEIGSLASIGICSINSVVIWLSLIRLFLTAKHFAMPLESELADLRQPLLRFAKLQLRNDSAAEDVVSETMLAILEKPDNFEGRSSLRSYATGILKFKIIDAIRKRGREVHIEPLDEQSMDDAMDALFARDGHWAEPPAAWQEPDKALQQGQFFEVLQTCVDRLPARIGRVFMMREWLGRNWFGELR